jgi:hypothetical protein
MRNASDMLNFALQLECKEGMGKWGIKHFGVIENHLSENDDVVIALLGLLQIPDSPNSNEGNYALALTKKKVLFAQKTFTGEIYKEFDYEQLKDLSFYFSFGSHYTFNFFKDKYTLWTSQTKEKGNGFFNVIKEYVDEVKNINIPAQAQKSNVELIREYKSLLDDGIITVEEFNEKKKELLK